MGPGLEELLGPEIADQCFQRKKRMFYSAEKGKARKDKIFSIWELVGILISLR